MTTERPIRATAMARRTRDLPDRRFDTTELDLDRNPYIVHRDYAAHYFKYGFVAKRSYRRRILDVGCGSRTPLAWVISYTQATPNLYVGVDYAPVTAAINRVWATAHENLDMTSDDAVKELQQEYGLFDMIVCLEVIEHMPVEDGRNLLVQLKRMLTPDGEIILSTPVFDGHMAANHVHEYEVEELRQEIHAACLEVTDRFGTFMNYRDVHRALADQPQMIALYERIREFYDDDVAANWLAPAFPDLSRNNVWILHHA